MDVTIKAVICSMVKPDGSTGNADCGRAPGVGGRFGFGCATAGVVVGKRLVGLDGIRL